MMAYKWKCPHDWLDEQVDEHAAAGRIEELVVIIAALAGRLDDDSIQDLFEEDMAGAGYFDEIKEG